jgi:hypothetical protein
MKIYLSGLESKKTEVMDLLKNENGFFSYYYLKQKNEERTLLHFKKAKDNNISIIIDSGAHTWFTETGVSSASTLKKTTKTKETPEEFFNLYLKWIEKYYEYIEYYVELDVGQIVGQEKVDSWYEQIKEKGFASKCIRVYHPTAASDEWLDNLINTSESKFIGLEGKRKGKPTMHYNKIIKKAFDKKVKVHGFAMTGTNDLLNHPWYSVDSTSWRMGEHYGACPVFDEATHTIKYIDYDNKETIHMKINYDRINERNNEGRYQLYEIGINAFLELQRYITKVWTKRNVIWE